MIYVPFNQDYVAVTCILPLRKINVNTSTIAIKTHCMWLSGCQKEGTKSNYTCTDWHIWVI